MRSRTGSARAANIRASSAAWSSLKGASTRDGQQTSAANSSLVVATWPPRRCCIDSHRYICQARCIDRSESIRRVLMSRVQLALYVSDLDEAVGFYSKLFATAPAKL